MSYAFPAGPGREIILKENWKKEGSRFFLL
jgi:hypothetical protein